MVLGAARELDRHGEGEYHVRTDFLAKSTLLGGAVILMRGGGGRAMCTWHTTIFPVCQAQAGIWKTPLDSSSQDDLGLLWATQQPLRSLSGSSSVTGLSM